MPMAPTRPHAHSCFSAASAALLLALALACGPCQAVAQNGTAAASPCWHVTHFVTTGVAACQVQCKTKLASANNVGTICPKMYTVSSGQTCCKCQYRKDPAKDPCAAAPDTQGDDPITTDADLAKQQAQQAKGKPTKKTGRVWWKLVIVLSVLALIIVVTSGMLFWDCCKCRRRQKDEVAELKAAVQGDMDKHRGGKKGERSGRASRAQLSEDNKKRLEALDLALEMRHVKFEAQPPARFEVVVNAASASPAQPASPAHGTSSSVPASPARSRFQRFRTAVNPFA